MHKEKKARKPRAIAKFNTGTIIFSDKKKEISRKRKYKKDINNAT